MMSWSRPAVLALTGSAPYFSASRTASAATAREWANRLGFSRPRRISRIWLSAGRGVRFSLYRPRCRIYASTDGGTSPVTGSPASTRRRIPVEEISTGDISTTRHSAPSFSSRAAVCRSCSAVTPSRGTVQSTAMAAMSENRCQVSMERNISAPTNRCHRVSGQAAVRASRVSAVKLAPPRLSSRSDTCTPGHSPAARRHMASRSSPAAIYPFSLWGGTEAGISHTSRRSRAADRARIRAR